MVHCNTYGYESKCKVWIKALGLHAIHTLIHTLWYCMIHTLDPYPCSIPLSCWRMTDVGPNAAFCPNTASGPRAATTVATTTAASSAPLPPLRAPAQPPLLPSPRLLLLLPLLVIFLLGAAAAVCRFCYCSCCWCSCCWCWFTSFVCFW